jgi:uncharacterized integral membrane protein
MIEPSIETGRSRQVKAGIILLLLFLVLIFTLQNTENMVVVFLWKEFTLPRALILFLFFVIGFVAGLAVNNWKIMTAGKTKIEP